MTDEVSRILMESRAKRRSVVDANPAIAEEAFPESAYLHAYPDVAENIANGMFQSGYEHYQKYGQYEGRNLPSSQSGLRDQIVRPEQSKVIAGESLDAGRASVEGLLVCPSGGLMIIGWVDDSTNTLDHVLVTSVNWQIRLSASGLVRVRRQDVEGALGTSSNYSYGFIGLHFESTPISAGGLCKVELVSNNLSSVEVTTQPRVFDDMELRDVALSHLSEARFFSNYQIEAISNIGAGFGQNMVALNLAITSRVVKSPYVEKFGSNLRPISGSIVICLYGRIEYLFLQCALFSHLPGIEDYEFIYVSNSPELSEALLREAKSASRMYDLRLTVVLLQGNAGFGAANNAAVKVAQSGRILNINPDVFPKDLDWAQKHTSLTQERPKNETQIFGVPLYYDDGSLMHGGMYFELDSGVLLKKGGSKRLNLVRVEHYGKGAPAWVSQFTRARRVPAVTGAFISSDRAWYEKLGGFTEDYVFGHYEDADLCLKSATNGRMPWIHDLRLWHLEGKGSTRRPVHDGGSLVNRWLFSSRWAGLLEQGLLGPAPDIEGRFQRVDVGAEGLDAQTEDRSKWQFGPEPSSVGIKRDPGPVGKPKVSNSGIKSAQCGGRTLKSKTLSASGLSRSRS